MEELLKKLGYQDTDIKNIIEGMKKDKIYTSREENIDERYNKLKEQKIALEEQIKGANDTISDLKKNSKNSEDIEAKVKEWENKYNELDSMSRAKIKNMTIDYAINSKLSGVNEKYRKLLCKEFDIEKLEVKDTGEIIGLDEQFKDISETYKEWFESSTPSNTGSPGNFPRKSNVVNNPFIKETFNLTEQGRLLKENPDKAKEFAAQAGINL
ncbi:TPA: phage scaffolding protein [Clostridioides difficile]|nr:phage scaffolding protein [Clostridioides difficile]HBF1777946.1 phage scaffolding protein [Clostridioides difficile]HBH3656191.1 phage scaffolding protein [Clostridioides difficile]